MTDDEQREYLEGLQPLANQISGLADALFLLHEESGREALEGCAAIVLTLKNLTNDLTSALDCSNSPTLNN